MIMDSSPDVSPDRNAIIASVQYIIYGLIIMNRQL